MSIAKAIGIILVVVGHAGCPDALNKFIYSFHMPFFFILSGYFFKEVNSGEMLWKYMLKKIRKLWLPYVLYCIPFIALHNVLAPFGFDGGKLYDVSDYMKHFLGLLCFKGEPSGYFPAFWFLRTLFLSSIILAGCSLVISKLKLSKDRMPAILVGMFCIIEMVMVLLSGQVIVKLTLMAVVFLCIGIFYRIVERRIQYSWILLVVTFLTTFFCSYSFKFTQITEVDGIYLMTYISIAVIGSLFVMALSQKIKLHCGLMKRILIYIGNHTMTILALHAIVFKFLNNVIQPMIDAPQDSILNLNLSSYAPWLWIIYSLAGVIVPIMIYGLYEVLKRKIRTV